MFRNGPNGSERQQLSALTRPIVIFQVIEGLRRGLSRFLGPTRVALLLGPHEADPLLVFDPHNLLSTCKDALRSYYMGSAEWRQHPVLSLSVGDAPNCRTPEIPELICWGKQSSSVAYQMWFAERAPSLCSSGPVEAWLSKASWILAHELALGASIFTSSATYTLESYALYAVSEHLQMQLQKLAGGDPGFRIEEVLKSVAAISTTYEEGQPPTGSLVFVPTRLVSALPGFVRFPEGACPVIRSHKHVRKLLTMVDGTSRFLISDGRSILGIGSGATPPSAILVRFRSGHGEVQLGTQLICTFRDGEFSGQGRTPELRELERALCQRLPDPAARSKLLGGLMSIVQRASDRNHGCTIVLDFGRPLRSIPGQSLAQPVAVLENLDLIEGMSRVDGALHIDSDCTLHAFACLLDGKAVAGEDLARGARYNSALRFTAGCPGTLAIVVSADGPISILEDGKQLNVAPVWPAFDRVYIEPPILDRWLEDGAGWQDAVTAVPTG